MDGQVDRWTERYIHTYILRYIDKKGLFWLMVLKVSGHKSLNH